MPTRSEPASPGPSVTGDRVEVPTSRAGRPLCAPRRGPGSSSAGGRVPPPPGTMPPVCEWSATWLATTLATIRRPPLNDGHRGLVARGLDGQDRPAAASLTCPARRHPRPACLVAARARAASALRMSAEIERPAGHDQGVLAVVRVVARTDADRPEAEALVELARRRRWRRDLERDDPGSEVAASSISSSRSRAPMPCRRHSGSTANVVMCASSTISQMPP